MNRYEIICTPNQTRKALELGAPISDGMARHNAWNALQRIKSGKETYEEYANKGVAIINGKYDVKALTIPTAEQMLGFLEENDIFININHTCDGYSSWVKLISNGYHVTGNLGYVNSREEATLAAIDAALEYLTNNKK